MQQTEISKLKLIAVAATMGFGVVMLSGVLPGAAARMSDLISASWSTAFTGLARIVAAALRAIESGDFDPKVLQAGVLPVVNAILPLPVILAGAVVWLVGEIPDEV